MQAITHPPIRKRRTTKKKTGVLLFLLLFALNLTLPVPAADFSSVSPVETVAYASNIRQSGTMALSLTTEDFLARGYQRGDMINVSFLDQTVTVPFCASETDVPEGSALLLGDPDETHLRLTVRDGDFASTYGAAVQSTDGMERGFYRWTMRGDTPESLTVTLSMEAPGLYLEGYYSLVPISISKNRTDFPSLTDAQFANFRPVTTTGMGRGVLYRTSSPVDPVNLRNTYADTELRRAGVTVVLNLADTREGISRYPGFSQSYYSTTQYYGLAMDDNFSVPELPYKLAEGLKFLAHTPGVYAVHCTIGRDRAGLVSALLECFMGASYDEIIADYMTTYYNYYGITNAETRYQAIANSNIVRTLKRLFEVPDLAATDLAYCAEHYFRAIGLTDDEITSLRTNLSASPAIPPSPNVPAASSVPSVAVYRTHVVQAGEDLWSIANRYYRDARSYTKIAAVNRILYPYQLKTGQILLIPL